MVLAVVAVIATWATMVAVRRRLKRVAVGIGADKFLEVRLGSV